MDGLVAATPRRVRPYYYPSTSSIVSHKINERTSQAIAALIPAKTKQSETELSANARQTRLVAATPRRVRPCSSPYHRLRNS
jgi:hypothetical protein